MAEGQRRTTSEHILRTELNALTSQNTRLQEENNLLRQKLTQLTGDYRSNAAINVEAKIAALRFEDERDQMYDNFERLKKKYNKLHAAYLEKVQRCKALEDTFKRQKTLTGLVSKTAINQRVQELHTKSETENLEKQVAKLQTALDETYDIIDALEFELESIDYLEQENQRMRNELFTLKSNRSASSQAIGHMAALGTQLPLPTTNFDEPPPSYADGVSVAAVGSSKNMPPLSSTFSSTESLSNDDADSETLERAAMTQSLIDKAAVESSQLRRELLKCRLQNTSRPK